MQKYIAGVDLTTLSKGILKVTVPSMVNERHLQFALSRATGDTIFDLADGDTPTATKNGREITIQLNNSVGNLAVGDEIEVFFNARPSASFNKESYKETLLSIVDKESNLKQLGNDGAAYISSADLGPTTGPFFAFCVIQECTFHAGTEVPSGHEAPPISFSMPAGTLIYTKFNKIQLATGKGIAYKDSRALGESYTV